MDKEKLAKLQSQVRIGALGRLSASVLWFWLGMGYYPGFVAGRGTDWERRASLAGALALRLGLGQGRFVGSRKEGGGGGGQEEDAGALIDVCHS